MRQTNRITALAWLHRVRWLLLCTLLLALPLRAQSADRAIAMQAFTQEQGLSNLGANVLLRDRKDVLWVGTDSGLLRFDGKSFVAVDTGIDPLKLHVNDLYQAPSGRIWIGTARRLYAWQNGRIQLAADVPVDDLRRIAGDGGDGVYVRHQHQLLHVSVDGAVTTVSWPRSLAVGALTDGPLLWFRHHLLTTCAAQLCMRTASGTRILGAGDGVPADQWISFHVAPNGDLWVGGTHHLLHLRAGAERFEAIPSANPIDAIDVDAHGRVLAAGGGRVSRWDGTHWQTFADDQSLQSAQIRDLRFDPAGSVWLATGGRGVLRWRGYGQFQNWLGAQGLDSAPTWAIARDADGRLWLGNQRFGNLLEPGAQQLTPWPRAMRRPEWTNTTALLPHGRQMWIIFNNGVVVRYDLDTRRALQVASHTGWTKFGLVDAQGRLWFGTHGSLWRIDHADAAHPVARRMRTGLPPDTNYLGAARDSDGRLWFATTHGLLRFRHNQFTPMHLGGALPAGGFAGVAATGDDRLWLAPVAGGLFWLQPGDDTTAATHDSDDSLLSRTALYSLEADRAGRLWAASDKGIDVLIDGHWRRLDRSDGLAWNDISPGAFLADNDGSVWLGTSGGVTHLLHPQQLDAATVSVPVLLDARYGNTVVRQGQAPRLHWSGRALTVVLASTGMAHVGSGYFEYRLSVDGSDTGWETSSEHDLRFVALAPGSYRFQARWVDPNLRARSAPIRLDLVIVPPWWRSNWAHGAYVLLIALLLLALWRLRNARLLRRQARLEHLVDQRTRELKEDKRKLEIARKALQYEATHDALTGLLSRGAVVEALVQAVVDESAQARLLAVVLIDLDHFKRVNDTHGHLAGDAVLVQCAERLRQLAPPPVALGRYGGEELLLVWPGLPTDTDLSALFAPLLDARYHDGSVRLRVTCSAGVTWARHDDNVNSLLRRADAALYAAKQAGRARVERTD